MYERLPWRTRGGREGEGPVRAVLAASLVGWLLAAVVPAPEAQARKAAGRDSGAGRGRDGAGRAESPGARPAAGSFPSDPASGAPAPVGVAPLMTIAQLQYGGGGDWYANPTGLPNLLDAIRTRTGLPVSDRPAHVKITDPDLRQYPYLYMTGHGNVHFTDDEVERLREYLDAGGFLHADDNYGMDVSFRREIRRVFPDAKLVELPRDHAVYHLFYDFPRGLPKIHKHDGTPAQGFGVFHNGRLVVFYSYESDLGNGWEDPQTYGDPPALHEAALRMGVNLFMYATAQVAR